MDSEYTLVLDLDETLIHFDRTSILTDRSKNEGTLRKTDEDLDESKDNPYYIIRPFCSKFLTAMNELYEIVIFTAADKPYADWVLEGIDCKNLVSHRLYRQHCIKSLPGYDKDKDIN